MSKIFLNTKQHLTDPYLSINPNQIKTKKYERYYQYQFKLMKIILKNKALRKQQFLNRLNNMKFTSGAISKQIKDCIQPHGQLIKNVIINLIKCNKNKRITEEDYKQSMETTTSSISTRHHSVDRVKKKIGKHPQSQSILIQQINELNGRGSTYPMRIRNNVSNITKLMRVILGEWLMQLAHEIQIPRDAVYNAIYYTDKYVGIVNVSKQKYQSIGLCALFIASKLQLSAHPNINTFIQAIDGSITKQQLTDLQQTMLIKLKFKLNPPTLCQYMVLLLSLFNNFIAKFHPGYIQITKNSELYKNIFWVLDGIYLENEYKNFHGKQKVCLSVLYLVMKKYKSCNNRLKLLKSKKVDDDNIWKSSQFEKIFEEYLSRIIVSYKRLGQLQDCIVFYKRWMKYQRNCNGSVQNQIQQLKKIILNI